MTWSSPWKESTSRLRSPVMWRKWKPARLSCIFCEYFCMVSRLLGLTNPFWNKCVSLCIMFQDVLTGQIAAELVGAIQFTLMLSIYVSQTRCNIVDRTLIPLFDLADWEIKQLVQTDLRFAECAEVLARTVPKKSICCFAFTMPAKLSINDVDVSGKRVFMRVDFNVPQDKADPTKSLGFKDFASGFMWFVVSEVYVFVFRFSLAFANKHSHIHHEPRNIVTKYNLPLCVGHGWWMDLRITNTQRIDGALPTIKKALAKLHVSYTMETWCPWPVSDLILTSTPSPFSVA